MDFLVAAELLMPNYKLLSDQQKNVFLNSRAGQAIVDYLESLKPGWFSLETESEHEEKSLAKFQASRAWLLNKIKSNPEYKPAKIQIIACLIVQKYPHMKQAMSNLREVENRFEDCLDDMDTTLARMDAWYTELTNNTALVSQQLRARAEYLAAFFPLLNTNSPYSDARIIDEWLSGYYIEDQLRANVAHFEEAKLTEAIFLVLREQTIEYDEYVHQFNLQQAQIFAKAILSAFNQNKPLPMYSLLEGYQHGLFSQLQKQWLMINGKAWQLSPENLQSAARSAISSLLAQVSDALAIMADGHAIIQATGFATQNENSHLAFLDFINYWRYAQHLSELKTIAAGLSRPLLPLYLEYLSIGLNKKNVLQNALRALIPIMIVALVIVAAFSLFIPALPELAAFIVLLPILYIGLLAATTYIEIRDGLSRIVREFIAGDPYLVANYQINQRMLDSFLSLPVAEMVRDYYVNELKICDTTEQQLAEKNETGCLNSIEINIRNDNIIRKNQLLMEWLDIHDNRALGVDKVKQEVRKRFHRDGDKLFQQLEKTILESDLPILNRKLPLITSGITAAFENRAQPSGQNIAHEHRFFRPECFKYKQQLQLIDAQNAVLQIPQGV